MPPAPYKLTKTGKVPASELRRREHIRATMRRRASEKYRDSRGRFTTRLHYGIADVRERSSDDVDYGVPFVLAVGAPIDETEAEARLVGLFGDYAFWNVGLYATYKPVVSILEERENATREEAKELLSEMEDAARSEGGALAPIQLSSRVTVP